VRKKKIKERKEWSKEKEEVFRYVEVPIHECFLRSGTPPGKFFKKNKKEKWRKEKEEKKMYVEVPILVCSP